MNKLRQLIYTAKRAIQSHPALYDVLFSVATFNWNYARQKLDAGQYPSRFGGQWTDRVDFDDLLLKKWVGGQIDSTTEGCLRRWRRDGYIVLENAVEPRLIDALNRELDELPANSPPGLMVTGPKSPEPMPYHTDLIRAHASIRVVDHYFFSETARNILFSESLMSFAKLLFDAQPMLTQSLGFEYGSEQPMHQDTAFVITNSPMRMIGIWIALEDIETGSGELLYYPGSHAWPDYLFSGRFKHFDRERDGTEQLEAWLAWIHEEASKRNTPAVPFFAKKGDALLWHAALAHGGAPITLEGRTRRSLVGHYCPEGTRPLYHYYKPAQRRIYRHQDYRYTTSYYR